MKTGYTCPKLPVSPSYTFLGASPRRGRKDPESSERSFNLFRVVWDREEGEAYACTDAAGGAGGLL